MAEILPFKSKMTRQIECEAVADAVVQSIFQRHPEIEMAVWTDSILFGRMQPETEWFIRKTLGAAHV